MPEWLIVLIGIIGGLLVFMMLRLPIAFCFLAVTMIVVPIYWGGMIGLKQMVLDIFQSLATYSLVPLSLFILMGDVMFYSGIAPNMIDALDKWLGKIPGRLSLLAVAAEIGRASCRERVSLHV
jgi:TRAP-type mannitol/chloroaromatic compound transport system permease large subunit